MKKSTMIRSLVVSMLSLLLCVSMLVGTTFAWFTDEVESGKNTIKTGNLSVTFEHYKNNTWNNVEDAEDLFKDTLWEPGHAQVIYLKVTNAGNLALKYRLALNVLGQTIGKNKAGEDIKLSDYLNFGIIADKNGETEAFATRTEAINAVTEVHNLTEVAEGDTHAFARSVGTFTNKGDTKYFAIVVWMPETVGNEANHNGVNIPSIDLGVSLVATQYTHEVDSYDDQYDAGASFPVIGTGTTIVNRGAAGYEIHVRNNDGAKIASLVAPAGAVAGDADDIVVNVQQTETNPNIVVNANETAKTFDIKVEGLKSGNTEPVRANIRLAKDLDPNTVKVYHYDNLIPSTYNPHSGYVGFETTSFSPFTVVYKTDAKYQPVISFDTTKIPEAEDICKEATEYENVDLEWGSYGQWSPTEGLDSQLEAAFTFTCPAVDNVQDLPYANWYCDFYVMLKDADLGENQIFLGGNYGDFGWVGFHNGDVKLSAGEAIPLLGSVTSNPWTYADVNDFVGTFVCGVGDVDDALVGKTFVVMLRLTNPENENEFYNVVTVEHTFQPSGAAVEEETTVETE